MEPTIRLATIDDARDLARVQIEGWRWGYRDVMPAAYLDALSIDAREARWRDILLIGSSDVHPTWIARVGRACVGFASSGPARGEPAGVVSGELYAIYVARRAAGRGVAPALLGRAVDHLRAKGFGRAILWVLEENPRARRFYERAGWRADGGEKIERFGETSLRELRYAIELGRAR